MVHFSPRRPGLFLLVFILIFSQLSRAQAENHCEGLFGAKTRPQSENLWQNLRQELARMAVDLQRQPSQHLKHQLERLFREKVTELSRQTGRSFAQEVDEIRRRMARINPEELKKPDASDSQEPETQRKQLVRLSQQKPLVLRPVIDFNLGTSKIYVLDAKMALGSRQIFGTTSVQFSAHEEYVLINSNSRGPKEFELTVLSLATGDKVDLEGERGLFSKTQDCLAVATSREVVQIRELPSLKVLAEFPGQLVANPATFGSDWALTQKTPEEYTLQNTRGSSLNFSGPYTFDSVSGRIAFFDSDQVLRLYDAKTLTAIPIPNLVSRAKEENYGRDQRYFQFEQAGEIAALDLRTAQLLSSPRTSFEEQGLTIRTRSENDSKVLEVVSADQKVIHRRENLEAFPNRPFLGFLAYVFTDAAGIQTTETFDPLTLDVQSARGLYQSRSSDQRYFFGLTSERGSAGKISLSYFDTVTSDRVEQIEIPGPIHSLPKGTWLLENRTTQQFFLSDSLDPAHTSIPVPSSSIVPSHSPSGAYLVTYNLGRFQVHRIER